MQQFSQRAKMSYCLLFAAYLLKQPVTVTAQLKRQTPINRTI